MWTWGQPCHLGVQRHLQATNATSPTQQPVPEMLAPCLWNLLLSVGEKEGLWAGQC